MLVARESTLEEMEEAVEEMEETLEKIRHLVRHTCTSKQQRADRAQKP